MIGFWIFILAIGSTLAQQKCGQTPVAPDTSTKVVGGTIAKQYSWPWQIVWCENGWFGCDLECGGKDIL